MATQEIESNDGKIYSRIVKQQSARENFNTSTMASNKNNTKLVLSGACILILIVCGSVAVARVITNDDIFSPPDKDGPITSAKIVQNIRNMMNDTKIVNVPIQAYIIPSVDAHQSEYPTESDRRLKFATEFTGSAGTAVIAETQAALWTDSRYFVQAEQQIDNETWTLMKEGYAGVMKIEEWLVEILPPNSRVGIDPFLISASEFRRMFDYLNEKGHKLVSVQQNLVDLVWTDRPALNLKPLEALAYGYSGKRSWEKVKEVREAIDKLGAECLVVTALDDIAWLFNLRGKDIENNPVFFAYAIVTAKELYLYVLDVKRVTVTIENHFYVEKIGETKCKEYNTTLTGINDVIRGTKGKVILSKASEAINYIVPAQRRMVVDSPIVLMKVVKNEIEAKNLRLAHVRDGVAVVRYLHWLETEHNLQNITELSGAEKLTQFRSQQENFKGVSFEATSAVGAHAAIVHYSPTIETDARITSDEIYLIDSGGQYLEGTTDVTRTIHLGTPTEKEIDAFTRVLKGYISLSTAIFPSKAPYSFFDAMARRALWDVGLDYGHGTGHGVGAYLNVHEYPPLISSRNSGPGMLKNMFTSNEPGYYETGSFGIRIESVVHVVDAPDTETYFNGRGALKFDDITMVPIQAKLINLTLLTQAEIDWINAYHKNMREQLIPLLGGDCNVINWLREQTKPIGMSEKTPTTPPSVRYDTDDICGPNSLHELS